MCCRSACNPCGTTMEEKYSLLGYPLPFPPQDLYVALLAVAGFLPALAILNALVHGLINLVTPAKKAKTQ